VTRSKPITAATAINPRSGQMADVGRGRAVSKLLPTESSRDVTVFGIIAANTTRDAYGAHLDDARRLVALRSTQFGIINDPIAAGDVENIAVTTETIATSGPARSTTVISSRPSRR
jgi:hypothetical protein